MNYQELLIETISLVLHQLANMPESEKEKEVENFSIMFSDQIHLVIKPGDIPPQERNVLIQQYSHLFENRLIPTGYITLNKEV